MQSITLLHAVESTIQNTTTPHLILSHTLELSYSPTVTPTLLVLAPLGLPEHAIKPYVGSNCQDLRMFFQLYTVGQPLQLYLESTEDAVHGYIHFTFGGSGGDYAAKIDEELRNTYGFTDTYLFYVAEAAHKFVKTYLSGIENKESPMNCSAAPFQNNVLTNTAYPGEAAGPLCQCADSYFESEAAINSLIQVSGGWESEGGRITFTLSQSIHAYSDTFSM